MNVLLAHPHLLSLLSYAILVKTPLFPSRGNTNWELIIHVSFFCLVYPVCHESSSRKQVLFLSLFHCWQPAWPQHRLFIPVRASPSTPSSPSSSLLSLACSPHFLGVAKGGPHSPPPNLRVVPAPCWAQCIPLPVFSTTRLWLPPPPSISFCD